MIKPKHVVWIGCLTVLLFWSAAGLLGWVPLWWDEGWTINVARNWAVDGHYGHYLLGEPVGDDLAASWPVVLSITTIFRVFGIGLWQARFAGVVTTWLLLGAMYFLFRRLKDSQTATSSIAWLLLCTPILVGPLYYGTQAMGETLALLLFVAGLICMYFCIKYLSASKRQGSIVLLTIGLAAILLATSLNTKAQMQPFVYATLVGMVGVAFIRRWNREVIILILICATTWLLSAWMNMWFFELAVGGLPYRQAIDNILSISGFVLNPGARVAALAYTILLAGIPLLGILRAGYRMKSGLFVSDAVPAIILIRTGLLCFCASWFAWYILLANYFLRYLMPAVVISGFFTAELLLDWTLRFDWRYTINQIGSLIRFQSVTIRQIQLTLLLIFTSMSVTWFISETAMLFPLSGQSDLQRTITWLHKNTTETAIIESYDSELFFLLDRPYHYPHSSLSVLFTRRNVMHEDITVDYDPMQFDPDYIVIGAFGETWEVYPDDILAEHFQLIEEFGMYEIYVRKQ